MHMIWNLFLGGFLFAAGYYAFAHCARVLAPLTRPRRRNEE